MTCHLDQQLQGDLEHAVLAGDTQISLWRYHKCRVCQVLAFFLKEIKSDQCALHLRSEQSPPHPRLPPLRHCMADYVATSTAGALCCSACEFTRHYARHPAQALCGRRSSGRPLPTPPHPPASLGACAQRYGQPGPISTPWTAQRSSDVTPGVPHRSLRGAPTGERMKRYLAPDKKHALFQGMGRASHITVHAHLQA